MNKKTISPKEVKNQIHNALEFYKDDEGNIKMDKYDFEQVLEEIENDVTRPIFSRFYMRDLHSLIRDLAVLLFVVLEVVLIMKFI